MFRTLIAVIAVGSVIAFAYLGCDGDDSTGPIDQPRYHNPADTLFEIRMGRAHDVDLGDKVEVSVTIDHASANIAGYDVLIAYDSVGLHLDSAYPGDLPGCGWEFFDYEFLDSAGIDCGIGRPSGLVRVRGSADHNNWIPLDNGICTDSLPSPVTLFTLSYQVTDDRIYECNYWPIRFFWCGCDDNRVWLVDSTDSLHKLACRRIIDFDLICDISDSTIGFPSCQGFQGECRTQDEYMFDERVIDFINGGIDNICIDCTSVAPQPLLDH